MMSMMSIINVVVFIEHLKCRNNLLSIISKLNRHLKITQIEQNPRRVCVKNMSYAHKIFESLGGQSFLLRNSDTSMRMVVFAGFGVLAFCHEKFDKSRRTLLFVSKKKVPG